MFKMPSRVLVNKRSEYNDQRHEHENGIVDYEWKTPIVT